jgi:hypothetical protein
MRRRAALGAATLCLLAPAAAGASSGRPTAALSASPSRIRLAGSARETIRIANPGSSRVVVDVARTGFALDARGRPRVSAPTRSAAAWLTARPKRLAIAPGGERTFTVSARLPRRAEPGDHGALVLLTTRPAHAGKVNVRMRLGIVVTVRAPGKVVHRLQLRSLHVVRRTRRVRLLELALANRGNVTETVSRSRIRIRLMRRGHVLATLRPLPRDQLPHTRGSVALRYRGRARGRATAIVTVSGSGRPGRPPGRRFVVRL